MKEYRINYTGKDGKPATFKTYNPTIASNAIKALRQGVRNWEIRSTYINRYGEEQLQVSTLVGNENKAKAYAKQLESSGRGCVSYQAIS